jgi:hypothetical protein
MLSPLPLPVFSPYNVRCKASELDKYTGYLLAVWLVCDFTSAMLFFAAIQSKENMWRGYMV